MEYVATFAQNLGLLCLAAVLVFLFVDRFGLPQDSFRRKLFTGLVFGLVTVLVIEMPVIGPLGSTFDTRAAPVLVVGYLAGPFAGTIVAVFGAAARYHVGGPFALAGAMSPFLYLFGALLFRYIQRNADPTLLRFVGLALLGTVAIIPTLFVGRSFEEATGALVSSWPLIVAGNILGVVLLGVIFQQMLRQTARQKQLERLMTELSEQLEVTTSLNRSKDIFLANMSHELRTPLNAIIGFAGMIETLPDKDLSSGRVRDYATDIRKSGSTLAMLINDVLDVTKIEAGGAEIRCKSVTVGELVEEVCAQLSPLAEEKRTPLQREFGKEDTAIADSLALKQCLINVIGNAIKYAPPDSPIQISGTAEGDRYVISTEDLGQGIPEELKARIGEPFLRAGDPYTRNIEGTGLGLAITKRLMERQNGQLRIADSPSGGARVQLILPCNA